VRRAEIDAKEFLWGCALSAVLSVGLATALLYLARTRDDPHVGPTAASLDDGLSAFFGAALGLALACLAIAAMARSAPMVTALLASLVAYLVVLVPLLVITRPSDVGVGETLSTAVGLGVLVAVVATLASALGAAAGRVVRGKPA
jgi:hypothetical protein